MAGKKGTRVAEVTQTVVNFFEEVLDKTGRVIAVESDGEGGWRVLIETVEESDYMSRLGRSHMLGLYEVHVDHNLEILSYTRKGLRERTALEMMETTVS